MNTTVWLVVLAAALIVFVAVALTLRRRKAAQAGHFVKRLLATPNEQKMYWRLTATFPSPTYAVLAQVSFGALLRAKGGASSYAFSQKRADFVVADSAFKVLAVIELDDRSTQGREGKDASRDALLSQAGYKVLRYVGVPQPEKLVADLSKTTGNTVPAKLESQY